MIKFDLNRQKIIGVGVNPYDRLGLEKYLSPYTIICLENETWMEKLTELNNNLQILPLKKFNPNINLEKSNTKNIVESTELHDLIEKNNFQQSLFFVYKAHKETYIAAEKQGYKLVVNHYDLTEKMENKKFFREQFADTIRIPGFETVQTNSLSENTGEYEKYFNKFGKFVVQDDKESGGKGTFIINSPDDFSSAINYLNNKNSNYVVISKFIEGPVTSIQGCVTKYGGITTGLQQQVIADPLLVNKKVKGKEQFAGGQFGYLEYSAKTKMQALEAVKSLGKKLSDLGYKGIFGVDTIIDESGDLYCIEINARVTGLTPMIVQLQNDLDEIPLLLLHILELGNFKYTIENPEELESYGNKLRQGSYMLLHNKDDKKITISKKLKPGVYVLNDDNLEFIREGYNLTHLKSTEEFLIPDAPSEGSIIDVGQRMLRIITRDKALNDDCSVNKKYENIINIIERNIF